ncbi:MAG: alpha/beta fold hydrolase [Crocinitomicaceae bacterium]|nr:alpha/beta fold hydrolase [Crocinitomicaceae bacterium]
MTSSEGHIKFQKNGRYFTLGDPMGNKKLLIALHGYGHLAEFFIRKFNKVDLNEYFVICPEGLHRYYHNGTSGKVGASWMTKEDRLHDIEDYISFLNAILEHFTSLYTFKSKTLLGFSQGGATASRWLAYSKHTFDKFILWATVFPPDMEKEYTIKFRDSKNYFVFGKSDEYYTQDNIKEHHEELEALKIPIEMITFDGNHNIHDETLLYILNE